MRLRSGTTLVVMAAVAAITGICSAQTSRDLRRDQWMTVYYGPYKVGYRHIIQFADKLAGKDVYREDDSIVCRLRFGEERLELLTAHTLSVDTAFAPITGTVSTTITVAAKGSETRTAKMTAELEYKANAVIWHATADGKSSEYTEVMPEGFDPVKACKYQFGAERVRLGDKSSLLAGTSLSIADSGFLWGCDMSEMKAARRESIVVDGKRYYAMVLRGDDFTRWQTDAGEILKEECNGGLVRFVRSTCEDALKGVDALNTNVCDVYADRDIPGSMWVKDLHVRFIGRFDKRLIANDIRQSAAVSPDQSGVEYRVSARAFDPAKSPLRPLKDKSHAQWLRKSWGIESDKPEIRSLAESIVGNETSAYLAACKLRAWVYSNIKYDDSKQVPMSALEILKAKSGVCRHLALLFVALARSVGIPARLVAGYWYAPWSEPLTFGTHVWAECYTGEWVAFDPTTATDFVDATHIRLSSGNIDSLVDMSGGRVVLRAEVIDYGGLDSSGLLAERDPVQGLLTVWGGKFPITINSFDLPKLLPVLPKLAAASGHAMALCPHGVVFRFPADYASSDDLCKLHGDSARGTLVVIDSTGRAKRYPHGIEPAEKSAMPH